MSFSQEVSNTSNLRTCRSCGRSLIITKYCSNCKEPIAWKCESCPLFFDSTHIHRETQ